MKFNKEDITLILITVVITVIVGLVGFVMFDIQSSIYSAISAGLSVTVGKEYTDSLASQNNWNRKDIMTGVSGVIIGLIICAIFYIIR